MKILIAADMEGVTGVVHWDHVDQSHSEYPRFRRLMTGDVNAAIRGAFDAGAGDVLVVRWSRLRPKHPDRRAGPARRPQFGLAGATLHGAGRRCRRHGRHVCRLPCPRRLAQRDPGSYMVRHPGGQPASQRPAVWRDRTERRGLWPLWRAGRDDFRRPGGVRRSGRNPGSAGDGRRQGRQQPHGSRMSVTRADRPPDCRSRRPGDPAPARRRRPPSPSAWNIL